MTTVLLHAEAEQEFTRARQRYAGISEALGEGFAKEVRKVVAKIAGNPEAWPRHAQTPMRKCPVSRFPYLIYYRVLDDCIWIVAIAHARRRPGYWSGRVH
ncbi:MAG TPA: type II toxin-antitoxin system RelE/ParE family toxin [Phycisphaerae bacterium]|nr:type II toxin-antitoxin system RelE/ParE family toxin [Phycisphaerae bacterium]